MIEGNKKNPFKMRQSNKEQHITAWHGNGSKLKHKKKKTNKQNDDANKNKNQAKYRKKGDQLSYTCIIKIV